MPYPGYLPVTGNRWNKAESLSLTKRPSTLFLARRANVNTLRFFFRLYTFVTTEEKSGKESNKRECEAAEWLDHGPRGCESLAPNT